MPRLKTTLTTSGNSTAVRLPKDLLRMSGLGKHVRLEAKKGKIIISKDVNPHAGWAKQIAEVLAKDPHALEVDPELEEWDTLAGDAIEDE